jgi:1-hydroxycarotenoid 3,4-desaturase
MTQAIVIGAGMGGLASALLLAHQGVEVTVLEMGQHPGGKAGVVHLGGVTCDTGPSVLTMVDVLEGLFQQVGESLEQRLTLRRLAPAFRYLYPDGTALDIHHELDATLESVRATLGREHAQALEGFLRYAGRIWEASAPPFVYADAPSPSRLVRMDLKTLASMRHIDALSKMWSAICSRVPGQHLRWLLARYATYNGSDVRRCPATLNCISHVELARGGWGVQGGMHQIACALRDAAAQRGARFLYGERVRQVRLEGGGVREVITDNQSLRADLVVCNADARHLHRELLEDPRAEEEHEPSMSGWTGIFRASRAAASNQASHTVLFPQNYLEEFADIFDRGHAPRDPTLYACNQRMAHGVEGWQGADPLFVMFNAPAMREGAPGRDQALEASRGAVAARLQGAGLLEEGDELLWERRPEGLAQRFPGSRGSIYGSSSNSMFAAFRRPANRSPLARGLYLASGSAHPGGGVPLCLLSGRGAARAALEDLGRPLVP